MVEEVNFHEYPALSDLGPRNFPATRFLLKRDRMNLKEGSGLLQGERAHGVIPRSRPSQPALADPPRQSPRIRHDCVAVPARTLEHPCAAREGHESRPLAR